jgi:hypothetical protein
MSDGVSAAILWRLEQVFKQSEEFIRPKIECKPLIYNDFTKAQKTT